MMHLPNNKILLLLLVGFTLIYSCKEEAQVAEKTFAGERIDKNMKLTGAYNFAEYHSRIRTPEGADGPNYPSNYKLQEYNKAIANLRRSGKTRSMLNWQERGPGNIAGRARSLFIDPSDETGMTVYIGSVGGGVWKTTDGGNSWTHLTEGLPNLSATTIAGAPSDPQTLYLGTGEDYGATDEINGSGIWKSTDGGQNWSVLPTSDGNASFGSINSLLVDPEDPDHIVFAVRVNRNENLNGLSSFIGMSTDGGQTISAPFTRQSDNIQQIVADPNDFKRMLGTINSTGVIRSTNGGKNWSTLWSTDKFSRMALAISPMNSDIVFLSGYNGADTLNTSSLMYSNNGGKDFLKVEGRDTIADYLGNQGWYNNAIATHPTDSNTVYVAGASLIIEITVDPNDVTGSTIKADVNPLKDAYGLYESLGEDNPFPNLNSKGVHVDHHNLYTKMVGDQMYLYSANDGGFAMSADGGATFVQTGDLFLDDALLPTGKGLNTSQFYGADKANGIDRYVGGMQDNGSWHSPADPDGSTDWNLSLFGDGFECVYSYGDPNKFMVSFQFAGIFRTTDGGETFEPCVTPNFDGSGTNFPFITRLAGSKHEPDLVFTPSQLGLYRTEDFATVRPENESSGQGNWDLISMPSWFSRFSIPRVSIAQPDIVWASSSLNGATAVSIDRGRSFTNVGSYDQNPGGITNIATHPYKDSTAYFLFSQGDGPKVVVTHDMGQTYEDISGFNRTGVENSSTGFPDVAVYSLLVMPYDENIIWAGTDIGIVESTDGGQSWAMADNGLPNTAVWQMTIVNDEVVVATHGRGVWTVSIPELEGYEPRPVPSLIANRYSLDGDIAGTYKLRTPASEAKITVTYEVDGEEVVEIFEVGDVTTTDMDLTWSENLSNIPEDEIILANFKLETKVGDEFLNSYSQSLIINIDAEDPVDEYENNFDEGQQDFALKNFIVGQANNFNSNGLETAHPYPNLTVYNAVFQKPIIVTDETNTVAFDEIAIIEPGDPGSVFPDPEFWDYMLIEATNNRGLTWDTIAAYDAREYDSWENQYDNQPTTANPDLSERRIIFLEDYYDIGDEVFLAFTFESDPFVNAWGWRMDNFLVGNSSVNTIDIIDDDGFSARVIQNPVQDIISLELINNKEARDLRYNVVDMNGRLVHQGRIINQFRGEQMEQIDVSNLPAGLYLVNVQYGRTQKAIRVVKQ